MLPFVFGIGLVVLILGGGVGFGGADMLVLFASLVGGGLLLALAFIGKQARSINHRLLGLPLNRSQIQEIIAHTAPCYVESELFEVYRGNETKYALIRLDGEDYLNTDAFRSCCTQLEYSYSFALPGKEQVALYRSDAYFAGVDLFALSSVVYVRLSRLGLKPVWREEQLFLIADETTAT